MFRLGKGQFHSYLPKHLAPFPHVKPGSAQAWDSCQAVEVYLAWKAFLGIQGRSSLYAEFQGKLNGLSLWEGYPGSMGESQEGVESVQLPGTPKSLTCRKAGAILRGSQLGTSEICKKWLVGGSTGIDDGGIEEVPWVVRIQRKQDWVCPDLNRGLKGQGLS